MMASKARRMGDHATLQLIMSCGYDPHTIKKLGRRVSPWDEPRWVAVREAVVAHGNYLKFSQDRWLLAKLLGTGSLTLVEAAGNDKIWGIGVNVQDAANGATWNGLNLLGKALETVREALLQEIAIPAPFGSLDAAMETDEVGEGADGEDAGERSAARGRRVRKGKAAQGGRVQR